MAVVQPAYTAANVLTGQARGFYQVYNASSPPTLPARATTLGAWASPWQSIGATMNGLTFNFKRSVNDIKIEEQRTKVAQFTTDAAFSFDVELSEDTFKTMQLAYGGGTITTVAAGTGTVAYQSLTPSAEMSYFSFGFDTLNEFGYPRYVLIPIVQVTADVKTQYNRAKQQRTYNVTVESLVEIDQCTFINVTAPGN